MSSVEKLLDLREADGFSKLFKKYAEQIPQLSIVVEKQKARKILVKDRWVYDFASCNYLGFDIHSEIISSVAPKLQEWGLHPSWSRMIASPKIYEDLEKKISEFLHTKNVLLFQTITLIHMGVLPLLAKKDSIILIDKLAHRSIYEACRIAKEGGAKIVQFSHNHLEEVRNLLEKHQDFAVKIIAVDGVYSMSGSYANLPNYVLLAKEYGAILYVDDAHGLGVIGERPEKNIPYGYLGNGIVNYHNLGYDEDNIIYVSGLSKSFSAIGAFISCTERMREILKRASTYIFSGPCPISCLASSLACLDLNQKEGEKRRAYIYTLCKKLITKAQEIGLVVENHTFFPIVTIVIGSPQKVVDACKLLWTYGILITPALFPARPLNKGAVRFTVTAANTEEEIDKAIEALKKVSTSIRG